MSWFCSECEEPFEDETPAYGWVCEPYCAKCYENLEDCDVGEPSLQEVAAAQRLIIPSG